MHPASRRSSRVGHTPTAGHILAPQERMSLIFRTADSKATPGTPDRAVR